MVTTLNDNPFSPEAIYKPYDFYNRLREHQPVYYNEAVRGVDDHLVGALGVGHPASGGVLLQRVLPGTFRRAEPAD